LPIGCRATRARRSRNFGKHILLVNFNNYVHMFAKWHNVPVRGEDLPMPNATAGGITIINFGMGSASAATIMDLLTAIKPRRCCFWANAAA
jgi:AMP nucleosidase